MNEIQKSETASEAPRKYQIRRLHRDVIVEGSAIDLCHDTMRLPNGTTETWDFVHHRRGGGAAVVPVLPDGKILMVQQYRPVIDRETLELPAGAREDPAEDGRITAERELLEETGYRAGTIRFLCKVLSAPSWCDESTEIYLAEQLAHEGPQMLDDAEEIGLCAKDPEDLLEAIRSGQIQDAKTVAGLSAAILLLKSEAEASAEEQKSAGSIEQ